VCRGSSSLARQHCPCPPPLKRRLDSGHLAPPLHINLPGVLTETTAELAAALTLSAARRVPEADVFMRAGKYEGWLPTLFVGQLLQNKTVGIIGAGRIGAAYARMMVEGHKMNLVYFDPYPNKGLEEYIK
jgi:hydroxypyruvate reductase 1